MKTLKVTLLLVFIVVGLATRRHTKPQPEPPARTAAPASAVNQEILQNAERLAETLRKCQQSAHKNSEIK
jgi:hypothetical protein